MSTSALPTARAGRRRRGAATTLLTAALLAGALLLSGCGADTTSGESAEEAPSRSQQLTASTATLRAGDAVPAPTGKVVLTVRGGEVTNVGNSLQLDLAQLESMGTVSYEVDDSEATGRRAEFSGPLLRTVLDVAEASGTTLHTVALNDYVVDIPASDARDLPVIVATRQDGKPMSVADYGPLRLIYPTDDYDLDDATYLPRWIWQLEKVVVR